MNRILLYGNNIVTKLLLTTLKTRGFSVELIKDLSDISDRESKILGIIDTTNALIRTNKDDDKNFLHNSSELTQLLTASENAKCPFLFLYKDSADLKPEASLFTALEIIDKYSEKHHVNIAKVIVEDIYGPNIDTSDKLKQFIESMIGGYPLTVNNDNNDHYLFHQDDLTDGLLEIIKYVTSGAKYKTFTLFPEEPIIEIELAHFLNSLSELPQEIEYSTDETEMNNEVSVDVNYPGKWVPQIELESGLISMLREMGIPIPDDALKELQTERERYFEDYYNSKSMLTNPASPQIMATDSTTATKQDYDEESRDDDTAYHFDDIDKPDPFEKASVDFDKEIDFDKSDENYDDFDLNNQKESVQDNYGYDYDSYLYGDTDSNLTSNAKQNFHTKGSYYLIALLALGLFAILMVPTALYLKDFLTGMNSLKLASESVENYDFDLAQEKSATAITKFAKLDNKRIPYPLTLIGKLNELDKNEMAEILGLYKKASNAVNYVALLGEESQVFSAQNGGQVLGVSSSINTTDYLNKSLELLEELKNGRSQLEISNTFVDKNLFKIIDPLIEDNDKLSKLKVISPALDKLTGKTGAQKYLLVYQDSKEIRGTGGIIELYGTLTIDKGRLQVDKLQDARQIDDQIVLNDIQIDAPKELNDIFRTDRLLFRDSSWNPDFSTSASQMKNLYEIATDSKVDGVMAINPKFVKDLVGINQNTNLKIQNENITTENFDQKLIDYASKSRSTYISYLAELTQNSINEAFSPEHSKDIILTLYNALNNKDLLLYHDDNNTLSSIMQNNWAGSMAGNYDDYLYVVDSNISKNKVNHNIVRKIEYEGLKPEESSFTRRVLVTYNNLNPDMPINNYINHVRLYVPSDATLNSAFIISGNDKKMITKDIKLNTIGNKAVYSTEITVKPQDLTTLLLEFETPNKTYDDKDIKLVVQKQPGSANDTYQVRFSYSLSEINKEKLDKSAIIKDDAVIFESNPTTDQIYNFPL